MRTIIHAHRTTDGGWRGALAFAQLTVVCINLQSVFTVEIADWGALGRRFTFTKSATIITNFVAKLAIDQTK